MPCARVCWNTNKLLLSVTEARYIQALNIRRQQMLQAGHHTARYPCSINQRTSTNLSRDWVIYPLTGIYLIAQILLCCNRHSTCKPTAVSCRRRHLHLNLGRIFVIDRLVLIRRLVQLLISIFHIKIHFYEKHGPQTVTRCARSRPNPAAR
jgi:hypothetical protein